MSRKDRRAARGAKQVFVVEAATGKRATPLSECFAAIARELRAKAGPKGDDMSREEIAAMWGH